jgi:hypothetical protein
MRATASNMAGVCAGLWKKESNKRLTQLMDDKQDKAGAVSGGSNGFEQLRSPLTLFDAPFPPTCNSSFNPNQNVRGDARWTRNLCRPAARPQAMPHISGTRKQGAVSMVLESLERKEGSGEEVVEADEADEES